MVVPAPREADSHPPNTSNRDISRPAIDLIAPASAAATAVLSANPLAGPSMATNSNGTFCATVVMTCCSLALGACVTSHTLLPATFLARFAASKSACPAQGSSTAGNIISFLSPGPVGVETGSRVCRGSGTMLPQTTI